MTTQEKQTALIPPRKEARLVDLMRLSDRKTRLETNVAYPCTVKSFDATSQLVTVTVDFADVLGNDSGELVLEPDEIPNLLLSTPGQGDASGGYLTFPVQPGNKGHVTVFDRSIDRWRARGEAGDPRLRHTHNRIDGVFTPGLRDKSRAIPNFDQAAAVLEHTMIKLGANATEAAVLGDTLTNWMGQVTQFLATHVHPGVMPGGASTSPVNAAPTQPVVTSTKVKVE